MPFVACKTAAPAGGSTMMRFVMIGLVVGAAIGAPATAQDDIAPYPEERDGSGEAAKAIAAEVEVEKRLLEEALGRFRGLASRRNALLGRIVELYAELDREIGSIEEDAAERVERLLLQIDVAEGERNRIQLTERTLIQSLDTHVRRITLLDEQLAELEGEREESAGALTGEWDIVLLPLDQRGTFSLRQSGTLVTGTYRLAGGWTGSLQGTLVKRKVFLVRIDAELGKSMELEGFLSVDGSKIKGSWLRYELAGRGEAANGQWSATKR
jgi:hypothetical protein